MIAPIKASQTVYLRQPSKSFVYDGVALVPVAETTGLRTFLSKNERWLFFKMISSNIEIISGLGEPSGRVLACILM